MTVAEQSGHGNRRKEHPSMNRNHLQKVSAHRSFIIPRTALLGGALCLLFGASCMPNFPRDTAGNLQFISSQIRHAAGLPYFCTDMLVAGKPVAYCHWIQEKCEETRKHLGVNTNVIIKSECQPTDEVYCYTHISRQLNPGLFYIPTSGVVDATCGRTREQCENWRPIIHAESNQGLETMDAKDESACQRVDKSFQPAQ
jgi:hypothetical protein